MAMFPSQPLPPKPLCLGMGQGDQELACLHTDALLVHYRLELAAGCKDAAARAAARRKSVLAASARRDVQAAIFGERTAKQRREDDVRAGAAGKVATNPAVSAESRTQPHVGRRALAGG